jgi:hypothetical protein
MADSEIVIFKIPDSKFKILARRFGGILNCNCNAAAAAGAIQNSLLYSAGNSAPLYRND